MQTLPPDGLTQDLTPNFEMDWKWCLKATSGSSDANCWGRGTCRQPALRGRSLGEGDEQLLQQTSHRSRLLIILYFHISNFHIFKNSDIYFPFTKLIFLNLIFELDF